MYVHIFEFTLNKVVYVGVRTVYSYKSRYTHIHIYIHRYTHMHACIHASVYTHMSMIVAQSHLHLCSWTGFVSILLSTPRVS